MNQDASALYCSREMSYGRVSDGGEMEECRCVVVRRVNWAGAVKDSAAGSRKSVDSRRIIW